MSRQNQHDLKFANHFRSPAAGGRRADSMEMAGLLIGTIVILLLTVTM